MMPELIPIISPEEIQKKIVSVAQHISTDYEGKNLILIGMLKGAFIFLSDLVRHISIPVQIDFLRVSSYGDSMSSGNVKLTHPTQMDVAHRHLLLVEDIVDTGHTLSYVINHFQLQNPASVRICAFIDKHERRETDISVDYSCFTVADGFLVGYGLDYAENYRELPGIFHLKI